MIAAALALLSSGWAWALALGWLLPAASAAIAAIATVAFGGDWWLALIAAGGIAGFVFIWVRVGLKPALIFLGAVGAVLIDQRAAERGARKQQERDRANADRAVDQASRARADADRRSSDPGRLRDDDGFRRD